jgi:flavin-dependent dehydrogenase
MSERESMPVDVVIVGAGPAGLAAAIRLKQLDAELDVVVLEKGRARLSTRARSTSCCRTGARAARWPKCR